MQEKREQYFNWEICQKLILLKYSRSDLKEIILPVAKVILQSGCKSVVSLQL